MERAKSEEISIFQGEVAIDLKNQKRYSEKSTEKSEKDEQER